MKFYYNSIKLFAVSVLVATNFSCSSDDDSSDSPVLVYGVLILAQLIMTLMLIPMMVAVLLLLIHTYLKEVVKLLLVMVVKLPD